jgi:spoIIIJ-associated protein
MDNIRSISDRVYCVVGDILRLLGEKAEVRCRTTDEALVAEIQVEEPGRLIGKEGRGLEALQYIVQRIMGRQETEEQIPRIIIDINGYRKKREEELGRMARDIAERVSMTGRSVLLEPMNAWERRAIHVAVRDHKEIDTESEETDEGRRVRIKPRQKKIKGGQIEAEGDRDMG